MGKFFGKKDKGAEGGDEDSKRSALFGSRSKSKSSESSSNPYAQSSSSDPYASRQQAPPPYQSGPPSMDSRRQEKSPVPPGGYGGGAPRYGGQGSYGNQDAYGSNRYGGGDDSAGQSSSKYGASGYGGFGRRNSGDTMATEVGREQLFGNAAQRQQERGPGPQQQDSYGASGAGGSQGYGAYGERQLTEEEQEEEDVAASKQEMKFIKQQDIGSTRNALRLAQQAEETGRDTLNRLGAQGERIHNTERNLDLAASQNRMAEEKARELKTLNKSMFAVHVANPFTSKKRAEARDQQIMDTHRKEREQRDATRHAAWQSNARQQGFQRDLRGAPGDPNGKKASLADRAKFQFEADSEDDEMENEIEGNLDMLHGAAGRLKNLGLAMNQEVTEQNTHIERITGKTDKVDDQIAMNRARLDRIH